MQKNTINEKEIWKGLIAVINGAQKLQDEVQANASELREAIAELRRLQEKVPGTVSSNVRDLLSTEPQKLAKQLHTMMSELETHADEVCRKYEKAARFSMWRVSSFAFACFFAAVIGVVAVVLFLMPDAGQMRTLRAEKAQLEQAIATLEARGAKANLAECGYRGSTRPCVHVTEERPDFSPPGRYRFIYGYY